MSHTDVWKIFKELFPFLREKVTEYFPTGRNAIRVRLGNPNNDYVFTYNDKNEWCFETVENYIKTKIQK